MTHRRTVESDFGAGATGTLPPVAFARRAASVRSRALWRVAAAAADRKDLHMVSGVSVAPTGLVSIETALETRRLPHPQMQHVHGGIIEPGTGSL